MNDLAPLPVVVPLATAATLLFVNTVVPRGVARLLALAAVCAEVIVATVLLHQAAAGRVIYWFGGWQPRHGVALGVSFTIDQIGAGGAILGGVVSAAAMVTGWLTREDGAVLFDALLLTTLAAMAGFCLTGDLFNMFVFFELMAVSAFGLAAYHTERPRALRAALNFAITNSVGAFLVLIGITLLYARTGALNLAQIGSQLDSGAPVDRLVVIAVAAIVAGFLVKAAVIPFHFWLIDTAAGAPTPLVMILAGVLDTLGVYAVARIYWTVFAPLPGPLHLALRSLLVGLGALSALGGGVLALVHDEPRRRLAFVMVSHTGILLVGVGCLSAAGLAGAAVYALGDGTIKAALFAGFTLVDSSDAPVARAPRRLGAALLALGGLGIAGLPLFGTGLGKAAIDEAASASGYPWAVPVVVVAAAFTGAGVLQMAYSAWTADPPDSGRDEPARAIPAAGATIAAVLLATSIASTALGRWATHAASQFIDTVGYQRQVLLGIPPLAARAATPLRISAGSWAVDLAGVAGAIALGAVLGPFAHRRPATRATRLVGVVRRLHDGSIGDSVAWLTVGAALIALTLALAVG